MITVHLIPLSAFVERHSQGKAAEALGITQGAVSKAIRKGRNIYVIETPSGIEAYEIKRVG